jgi:hypothetical protein
MTTSTPRRIRSAIAVTGCAAALALAGQGTASAAGTWGPGVTLTPQQAATAAGYPAQLMPYPETAESGTHSIRVAGKRQNATTWFLSYSGSVDKVRGKEAAIPMWTGGQRWSSAEVARAAYVQNFTPGPDYGTVTVLSGSTRTTSAVLMYTPDSGPQYAAGYQIKGQFLVSVACTRPFTVVGDSGRPSAATVAVRQGLRACVTALLAATVRKFP